MKTVIVERIQRRDGGSVKAYVTFCVNGIRIVDARIVEGSKGTFLSLPQKSWETREGQTRYVNIVEIDDPNLREEIQDQVLEAWRRQP